MPPSIEPNPDDLPATPPDERNATSNAGTTTDKQSGRPRHLYLIGYRGSGKSTVAQQIAARLGWRTVDSDRVIETQSGKSIQQIFAEQGEPAFRKLESQAIVAISQSAEPTVIALGGGAPMAKTNRNLMRATGKTVWLQANPELLWERISEDQQTADCRPNLTPQGGFAEVVTMLEARTPIYQRSANFSIDVQQLSPTAIAERIVAWYREDQ